MGRKREILWYSNHLKGSKLTDEQCRMLLKLHKITEENQGGIEELRNFTYYLTDAQVDEVIKNYTADVLEGQEIDHSTLTNLQTIGISYMYVAKRVLLGDSVGLGKTVQVAGLAKYLTEEYNKDGYDFNVLYLTEKPLVAETRKKLIKFSGLYFDALTGTKKDVTEYIEAGRIDNICGSYSLVSSPLFIEFCQDFIKENGVSPFDMVVIDESGSMLKNHKSEQYKLAKKLFADNAEYVILMNAGAFEDKLDRLYNQLDFLDDTLLMNRSDFGNRYKVYDWWMGKPRHNGKYKNEENFRDIAKFRLLRRVRKGQGAKMVNCSAEVITVPLSKEQKYWLKNSSSPNMAYNCPQYFDESFPVTEVVNPKLGALKGIIEKIGTQPCIVYTVLKEPQYYIKQYLTERGIDCEIMNGDTSRKDKDELIARFKSGELRVLVTNVQRGLDFGNCDHAVFFSFSGNHNDMVQFEGRINRDFHIENKNIYVILTEGKEKRRFMQEVKQKAQASDEFIGSDYSMILSLFLDKVDESK